MKGKTSMNGGSFRKQENTNEAQKSLRYKDTRFNGSEEQMKKYTTLIAAHGVDAGIKFKFHGKIANTLNAHRLIQYYQEANGPEVAGKIVECKLSKLVV